MRRVDGTLFSHFSKWYASRSIVADAMQRFSIRCGSGAVSAVTEIERAGGGSPRRRRPPPALWRKGQRRVPAPAGALRAAAAARRGAAWRTGAE
eukprot:gene20560-3502_t